MRFTKKTLETVTVGDVIKAIVFVKLLRDIDKTADVLLNKYNAVDWLRAKLPKIPIAGDDLERKVIKAINQGLNKEECYAYLVNTYYTFDMYEFDKYWNKHTGAWS